MALQSRSPASTVDSEEVARFAALADQWWDPEGKFRPLHQFNPVRLDFIRRHVALHFGRDPDDGRTLEGLRLLDLGCGGGLLSEPMTRLGARVVGVDPAQRNVAVARIHARQAGLDIDYRATTAEELADTGERFDVVLNMEVVEHVAELSTYLDACARLVAPGGLMFVATINRTPKAFALAILGAEYVLGWLPRGTHHYEKLVRPEELEGALMGSGLHVVSTTGVGYSVLRGTWGLTSDLDVNYMLLAEKPRA